jgi:death on curing protein
VQNHLFLDGNKRTGAAAAIIFLAMNEVEIEADEDGLVALTLSVACGNAGKPEIAEFFRSRSHPSPTSG